MASTGSQHPKLGWPCCLGCAAVGADPAAAGCCGRCACRYIGCVPHTIEHKVSGRRQTGNVQQGLKATAWTKEDFQCPKAWHGVCAACQVQNLRMLATAMGVGVFDADCSEVLAALTRPSSILPGAEGFHCMQEQCRSAGSRADTQRPEQAGIQQFAPCTQPCLRGMAELTGQALTGLTGTAARRELHRLVRPRCMGVFGVCAICAVGAAAPIPAHRDLGCAGLCPGICSRVCGLRWAAHSSGRWLSLLLPAELCSGGACSVPAVQGACMLGCMSEWTAGRLCISGWQAVSWPARLYGLVLGSEASLLAEQLPVQALTAKNEQQSHVCQTRRDADVVVCRWGHL